MLMTNLLIVPQIPNLPNLDEILTMETKGSFQTMSILNEVCCFLYLVYSTLSVTKI